MSYSPHTAADRERMLAAIGVESVDDLFADIPAAVRATRFELPAPLAEQEVRAELARLAGQNRIPRVSFLGAGVYRHLVPSVVSEVIGRAEFSTSYTPYQPEVSQGTLQSIYEFQSLICELTGMEVATASHYDGATATAEAALMACRLTRRHRVAVSTAVNPQVRRVLATYCAGPGIEIVEVAADTRGGRNGPDASRGRRRRTDRRVRLPDRPAAEHVRRDRGDGRAGRGSPWRRRADGRSSSSRRRSPCWLRRDPTAPISWRPRASRSASRPSYGGPYVGLMASRMESVRQMPGRLVGATRDGQGRKGYVLTLQAREQHIRREKAASNICTNQALCALAAATFLSAVGPEGLREVADMSATRPATSRPPSSRPASASVGSALRTSPKWRSASRRPPAGTPPWRSRGSWRAIPSGSDYPELADTLLLAATELTTDADIEALVEGLESTR